MTIHEVHTDLSPAEVIRRARSFFTLAGTPYAAFAEISGDGFLKLHLEVGEIIIAALPRGDSTWVRGSASRGGHLLARFLTALAPALDGKQTTHRHEHHETKMAGIVMLPEASVSTQQLTAEAEAQAA